VLTPTRRRGVEILDDAHVDPRIRDRSHRDLERSNRLLGGMRAAVGEVRVSIGQLDRPTLLDVGSGLADIPRRVAKDARRAGIDLRTIIVDGAESLLAAARNDVTHAVCANALALPFRDRSVDVVMCSQLLHHFENRDAIRLLREMHRVAKRAVVVSDLRRAWTAAIGFWLVSFVLRFHRVTRHDGVVSVLRGFTPTELSNLVVEATGRVPTVRRRLGFRLTARWSPEAAA
jgi:SAM-dependent methyltransferase